MEARSLFGWRPCRPRLHVLLIVGPIQLLVVTGGGIGLSIGTRHWNLPGDKQ